MADQINNETDRHRDYSSKIALFAYNFAHRKTQDFLIRLYLEEHDIHTVIAAEPVELDIPSSAVRTKVRHKALIHPRKVAGRIGARYEVIPHNNPDVSNLVQSENIEMGLIGGARILKKTTIDAFPRGIINFHPGLLPEVRGLDAMLWSIYYDVPLGVSAHLIDERVDAGLLLTRKMIEIYPDDTILDLSERLYETQLSMIDEAVQTAIQGTGESLASNYPVNNKMPADLERKVIEMVPSYVERHSTII